MVQHGRFAEPPVQNGQEPRGWSDQTGESLRNLLCFDLLLLFSVTALPSLCHSVLRQGIP